MNIKKTTWFSTLLFLTAFILCMSGTSDALAKNDHSDNTQRGVGNPHNAVRSTAIAIGSGGDMWTALMAMNGNFTPHEDNCEFGVDMFVEIDSANQLGFCIEIFQRGATSWENARAMCVQEGKRLPEVAEWKFACQNQSLLSLDNMIGDYEWTSNFFTEEGGQFRELRVPTHGFHSCNDGFFFRVSNSEGGIDNAAFRCVR